MQRLGQRADEVIHSTRFWAEASATARRASENAIGGIGVSAVSQSWTVPALVERIIDGDTFVLTLDLGWRTYRLHEHLRIAGINAPERNTEEGKVAKAWAEALVPPGSRVTVTSEAKPSFERTVGSLAYLGEDGIPRDYAMQAVRDGYAVMV